MSAKPTKAFVLAAGMGQRMRPLTDNCPKPLIEVGGRTMLDRTLDALVAEGVTDVVVNLHYLGDMIVEHLKPRKDLNITFAHEDVLLDTGGGVKKMLSFFGGEPFYVLNADVVWTDGPGKTTLSMLADKWDGNKMDLLLLLHTTQDLPDYAGPGDYYLPAGADKPKFAKGDDYSGPAANYIFAGPRIAQASLFEGSADGVFTFRDLFLTSEAADRLYAVVHDGAWYHVGTPEALEKTNGIIDASVSPADCGTEKKRAT